MSRGTAIGDAVRTTCVRRRLPRNERELTTSGHRKKVIFLALICQQRCERFAKGMFRLTHQSLLVGLSIVSPLSGERVWLRETRLSRCFSRGVNSATNVFLNSVNVAMLYITGHTRCRCSVERKGIFETFLTCVYIQLSVMLYT